MEKLKDFNKLTKNRRNNNIKTKIIKKEKYDSYN